MKVYCAGPIRGGTDFQEFFRYTVEFVDKTGHTDLCEISDDFSPAEELNDDQIFERDMKWLDECDVMIAEVSSPSLGAGFEVAYALYKREIPVLAVVNSNAKRLSAMIGGCNSALLTLRSYSGKDDLENIILEFLNSFVHDDN